MCDPAQVVGEKAQGEPYLLAVGIPAQVFLVVDNELLYEINEKDCVLGLLASFFVFNICYTKGCCNMYTFLEMLLFNTNLSNAPTSVCHFLAIIKS